MTGRVITISPRVSLTDLERLARTRLDRDGVAAFAAVTADGRQRSHLLRLRARLLADPALWVYGGTGRPDGTTWLTVYPAGNPGAGYFGAARTGQPDEDPDGGYWDGPDS